MVQSYNHLLQGTQVRSTALQIETAGYDEDLGVGKLIATLQSVSPDY